MLRVGNEPCHRSTLVEVHACGDLDAMTPARTKSTIMQNGGHHRVLATKWVWCCHRSLSPCPTNPTTSSHGVAVIAAAPTTTKVNATVLSAAMTFGRPSET